MTVLPRDAIGADDHTKPDVSPIAAAMPSLRHSIATGRAMIGARAGRAGSGLDPWLEEHMGQVVARRFRGVAFLGAVLLLLGGCATRSISDSGFNADRGSGNPFYRGELTEFDVLGIDRDKPVSEEEIAKELARRQKVALPKGGSLMLVQSGAQIPDDQMVKELDRYFTVVPFTGVPVTPARAGDGQSSGYAAMLRLAAAKSGSDVILCYWGIVETAVDREPSKVISWVPLVGAAIPDETQLMRIRIKVAVIDVGSGRWSMFSPNAPVDEALSTALARVASDQKQVAALKEKVYKAAVEAFVARYAS
jgi:hypothetical protein